MKTLALLLILSLAPFGLAAKSFKIESSMISKLNLESRENGDLYIYGTWKEHFRAKFEKFTRDNIGKRIDIKINGKIISSPNVTRPITGIEFVIPCENLESAMAIFSKLRIRSLTRR